MCGKRLEPEPVTRRDFLGLAGLGSALVAILGSVIGMARLPKPTVLPEPATRFRLGHSEEFPPGTDRVIPGRNVRVIATAEGIAAMSLVCTHLGCIVQVSPDGLACPCHGSKFDLNGRVVRGPAPRPLPWLKITRAPDGRLMADSTREVEPGTFYQA